MGGNQIGSSARRILLLSITLPLLAACSATTDPADGDDIEGKRSAVEVESVYTVDGWMSLEDEYVPRVCTQENGAADAEALKVQAVAARTYLLRAMRDDERLGTTASPVINGQSFQAYADTASDACRAATEATRGVVGRYQGELVIANYVAGSLVNADGTMGNDPTKTEKWITYNEGKTGTDVAPTALSYKARTDNRGCMGQNRSDWLSEQGYDYAKILRYFYGADLELNDAAVDPAEPGVDDPCNGVTYQGECQGDTVIWCESGQLNSVDCASRGEACAWESDAIGFNCL